MTCPLCSVVERCRAGAEPLLIAELPETFVVLGENQGSRGWCVAVLKEHCEHMAEMSLERQARVFEDVAKVAALIRAEFGPVRINYECLGNVVGHVHWHVVPRHADDRTPRAAVWGWSAEELRGTMSQAEREGLALRLRAVMEGKKDSPQRR